MARENFDVEVPEGTHLGFSRDTDGAYRAHLFDNETNGLVGHAELFEPTARDSADHMSSSEPVYVYVYSDQTLEDEREDADVLTALALLGIVVAAQTAAPHVKEWWSDKALPFLRAKRAKLSRPRREKGHTPSESPALEGSPSTSYDDVAAALEAYRASMSSAEARERFIAALVARLFSEEQLRLLRNARIDDESGSLELESAMATLTPQQLEDSIRAVLEANPSWPDQGTVAELGKLLNRGGGEYQALPRRSENIAEMPGMPRRPE